jgi:hypothetical protein
MKTLLPIRTAFLLVLVFIAIQAGAKDIYIRPGIATGLSPTVGNSTETDPAPFSELRDYLLAYDASTDNKLNVYFQNSAPQYYNVTDISTTALDRFLAFSATPGKVNELEVTFQPITPSNGGAKGVIFDGTGTANTRFVQLTGDASNPMSLSIEDVKIQNFKTNTDPLSSGDGRMSLFTIPAGASLTLDDVVIDQIGSLQHPFVFQAAASTFTAKNSTFSNMTTPEIYSSPPIYSASVLSFENCTLDTWETNANALISQNPGVAGSNFSFNDCTITNFDTGGTNSIINVEAGLLEVTNCVFTDNTGGGLYYGHGKIINSVFEGNTSSSSFGRLICAYGGGDREIVNNLFINNTIAAPIIDNLDAFHGLISQNTFTANTCTGTGAFINVGGGISEICFNSLYGNTITSGTLINFTAGGTSYMYNNTLSGNIGATVAIELTTAHANVVNNTIYNSGNVVIPTTNTSARVINNIVTGGSRITGMNTTTCQRNISDDGFFPDGNSSNFWSIDGFDLQFSPTLSGTADGNGRAVHGLVSAYLGDANHRVLRRGGTLSGLTGILPDVNVLAVDQRGNVRPDVISLGAVDVQGYEVSSPNIVISFDSRYTASRTPAPVTLDIADYILTYPHNITAAKTFVAFSTATLPNGALSSSTLPMGTTEVTFTPKITGGNYTGGSEPATFDFTVSASDGSLSYTKTGTITITVVDLGLGSLPGLIEPGDFPLTCYDYMGTVTFTSSYRFITSYTGNTNPVNGLSSSVSPPLNPSAQRMYGFSIPLVGDLDGDGYPEIIGTGTRDGNDGLPPRYRYLYIYNGQTGKLISRLPFDLNTGSSEADRNSGHHSSPSILALVDSDRDGKIEVIATFPGSNGSGTFPFLNKLVSYVLTPVKNSGGVTTSYTMALNPKWSGVQPTYNTGNTGSTSYQKAIPQIVDIDGDGDPEVVVYNKIYSAVTGQLKVTLDVLGSTAYVGSATNSAETQDGYIGFSYIYDLDFDGKYDVVAGGKVYYNINVNAGTYSTRQFTAGTGIIDGRTGVADIDGDGIPDIVVVNRASSSLLNIYVWDPGFLEIDGDGNVVRKASLAPLTISNLKAYRSLSLAKRSTGTNSYVYIGDIDGREQVYNGKTYRLPEIAILAGTLTYSAALIHPNVAGITVANGGIPTTGTSSSQNTGPAGALAALTWDASETNSSNRLKLSFVLGHNDTSGNTGFTMFDFDNDGMMEICYRDEATMRIIKASVPCVRDNMTIASHPNIILFNRPAISYTGFEYPVIADIDNDASAEVIVLGHNEGRTDAYGFIYALGNGSGDKFAPALPVWNQFMYDPFKINPNLTTPKGPAPNRLIHKYNRRVTQGGTPKVIENYQPYNNTLGQIFYHESTVEGNDTYMEPIIFLTQAYIASETDPVEAKRPKIVTVGASSYIEITIGNNANAKTDISVQTPIAVYTNNVSTASYHKMERLTSVLTTSNVAFNKAIKAGEEARIRIPITNPYAAYYVRLGDDSGYAGANWTWRFGTNNGGQGAGDAYSNPPADPSLGIGISSRAYRDCDWRDQTVKVSLLSVNSDAVTVQQYGTVSIDIFDNDELPSDLAANQRVAQNVVKSNPVAGSIQFANNKIIYTHDARASLPNNIDTFRYEITYQPSAGAPVSFTAFVYIYVLEAGSGGFAACYGNTLITKLRENPVDIRFLWNTNPAGSDIYPDNYTGDTDSLTINFGPVTTPKAYKVKPLLSFYNNERIDFAPGDLTIGVLGGNTGDKAVFRWTGEINTNWNDPRNWTEVKNGTETPVLFVPTACVDVIIPSGLQNYPMLTATATCADITMKNRAMIAGIHYLTYDNARVELALNAAERDRFIMWSAPLKSMYSGDYHFKDAANDPRWGDVYMNFFQQPNPDGSTSAGIRSFTATFKNLGEPLPLGKAFNLKVTSTTANSGKSFVFPQTDITDYEDVNHDHYDVSDRTNGSKFITHGKGAAFSMDVVNDVAGSNLVQIVNPYMAYLDVKKFLAANSSLSPTVYAIWDGNIIVGNTPDEPGRFTQMGTIGDQDNRFSITTIPTNSVTPDYIPPLQSFFVQKANGATAIIGQVNMQSDTIWVKTNIGSPYQLRADAPETNILRIKAVQGKSVSYAVLHYNESTSPAYNSKEDMHKLFYQLEEGVIPLEVYTFAPTKEVLAINSSSDFSQHVPLGLRTGKAGSVTLEFSGMSTFGHDVYLIDHAENNKETDLQKNPEYTFTITKKSASDKLIELNDRFSLRTTFTGIGLDNEAAATDVSVTTRDGYIYVQTPSPVSSLQVYNLTGALVYSSTARSDYFRIPTDGQQAYIVKVKMNDQYIIKKTFVK